MQIHLNDHLMTESHVESYLKDMGMVGLVSAWVMARQRLKELLSQGGHCDTLLWHMIPYLTLTWYLTSSQLIT